MRRVLSGSMLRRVLEAAERQGTAAIITDRTFELRLRGRGLLPAQGHDGADPE